MPTSDAQSIYWDPFDPEIDDDPYPIWRRMRDELPVYHNARHDFWALSRYHDVEAAHRDPITFSSAHGSVLEFMTAEETDQGSILFKDPPEHETLRKLVARAFTPRRIAALERAVREVCVELLEPLARVRSFDYVEAFAAQLPSRVIARLVGVPEQEREEQRVNIDNTLYVEPGVGMINEISLNARIRLWTYLDRLVSRREQRPQDDLISVISQGEIEDDEGELRRLTHDETVHFVNLLFSAGTETVRSFLGNTAVLLARHPEQQAALARDFELLPQGIEELLRYEAPSPVQARWATREVTLHGVTIPRNAKVVLLTASANRDPRAFSDPDRLDLGRKPDRAHVAFGYGPHFCLGAALARLEARVALEETLRRFPRWRLDPDRVVRGYTSTVRGYQHVEIIPEP